MACAIDNGRKDFSCKTSKGGLKNLYILKEYNADIKDDSTIAAGSMSASSSLNDVYKFELQDDGNTFSESNEVSRTAGTSVFTPTGAFVLRRQDAATQDLLENLSKMRAQVIIESHNGDFRLVGLENGVDFSIATTSGGAWSDMNGYNVTFTGAESSMAVYVASSLIGVGVSSFDVQSTVIDPNA